MNFRSYETAIPLEDSVVREVSLVLRDWNCIWKSLYVVCQDNNLILLWIYSFQKLHIIIIIIIQLKIYFEYISKRRYIHILSTKYLIDNTA